MVTLRVTRSAQGSRPYDMPDGRSADTGRLRLKRTKNIIEVTDDTDGHFESGDGQADVR